MQNPCSLHFTHTHTRCLSDTLTQLLLFTPKATICISDHLPKKRRVLRWKHLLWQTIASLISPRDSVVLFDVIQFVQRSQCALTGRHWDFTLIWEQDLQKHHVPICQEPLWFFNRCAEKSDLKVPLVFTASVVFLFYKVLYSNMKVMLKS